MDQKDFEKMYNGSYYTITGAGGNLDEWKAGYEEWLKEENIGKPQEWLTFKGHEMNDYCGLTGDNQYQEDLTFLAFPLDGLDINKLAIFKLKHGDRWFDDIVNNAKARENPEEDYDDSMTM